MFLALFYSTAAILDSCGELRKFLAICSFQTSFPATGEHGHLCEIAQTLLILHRAVSGPHADLLEQNLFAGSGMIFKFYRGLTISQK